MVTNLGLDIPDLMARAERGLQASHLLLKNEYFADAVSRAYYAMFYAATALLHSEGITVSKHSAVIAQVGKHFAKTGKIEVRLHRALIDVFDERQAADYGGIVISVENAENAYQVAHEFVHVARAYLDQLV